MKFSIGWGRFLAIILDRPLSRVGATGTGGRGYLCWSCWYPGRVFRGVPETMGQFSGHNWHSLQPPLPPLEEVDIEDDEAGMANFQKKKFPKFSKNFLSKCPNFTKLFTDESLENVQFLKFSLRFSHHQALVAREILKLEESWLHSSSVKNLKKNSLIFTRTEAQAQLNQSISVKSSARSLKTKIARARASNTTRYDKRRPKKHHR